MDQLSGLHFKLDDRSQYQEPTACDFRTFAINRYYLTPSWITCEILEKISSKSHSKSPKMLLRDHCQTITIRFSAYPNQASKPAPMNGFAATAVKNKFKGQPEAIQEQVLSGFNPKDIPIHRTLAEEFTICDRWFASVPGPTQPNRAFAHAATSVGLYKNSPNRMLTGLKGRTIFEDMDASKVTWKSYFSEYI